MKSSLAKLKERLRRGNVYRREDLSHWSNSVDRHLVELLTDGTLQKIFQGLYYYPKETVFGVTPPDESALVSYFLKDDDFLITSPNAYNTLGVGTTQLYNKRVVYNHKRHGGFDLGGRKFNFQMKLIWSIISILLQRTKSRHRKMFFKKLGQWIQIN